MWTIQCETTLSSSHQLRKYVGKCANLHGHNWKVKASLWLTKLDNRGLSIDFGAVKNVIMRFDHKHLNDFDEFAGEDSDNNPTAENLAKVLWDDLASMATGLDAGLVKLQVDIWETEKNRIRYEAPIG